MNPVASDSFSMAPATILVKRACYLAPKMRQCCKLSIDDPTTGTVGHRRKLVIFRSAAAESPRSASIDPDFVASSVNEHGSWGATKAEISRLGFCDAHAADRFFLRKRRMLMPNRASAAPGPTVPFWKGVPPLELPRSLGSFSITRLSLAARYRDALYFNPAATRTLILDHYTCDWRVSGLSYALDNLIF